MDKSMTTTRCVIGTSNTLTGNVSVVVVRDKNDIKEIMD